jgi:4-hydroxybenzoate polyprenyltransferase
LYVVILKKITYVDGLFIGLTPLLKILIGVVYGSALIDFSVPSTVLFCILVYLTIFTYGLEKKSKELIFGQKRDFLFGAYTTRDIVVIQLIISICTIGIGILHLHSNYVLGYSILILFDIALVIVKSQKFLIAKYHEVSDKFSRGYLKEE